MTQIPDLADAQLRHAPDGRLAPRVMRALGGRPVPRAGSREEMSGEGVEKG